jgi:para-aminobenzoate synthetase/4-amino-4-deoxychorismate lyase
VARAAETPFVLLVESHADPARERALLFERPQRLLTCREPSEVAACLREADAALRSGAYVAGFLAYEAGYGLHPKLAGLSRAAPTEHLVWLGVFSDLLELRGNSVGALLAATARGDRAVVSELRFDRDRAAHRRDFERIQSHLVAGDSYQVCQSLRGRARVEGDHALLFERLRARQRTRYSALIETAEYSILSLSPELFFRKRGEHVWLEPMKGTAPATDDPAENAARVRALREDPKTRAENVMIVDLLRNDIGRLARPGRVTVPELFAIERFDEVLQMTSTIAAEIDPALGLYDLMRALFPSGSITGAPKLRTMEIIAELEQAPRGIFCGSIGYAAPNGDACFNVAIRSLCVARDGEAVLGVGSGVVVDSTSDAEYEECMLKARFLAGLDD